MIFGRETPVELDLTRSLSSLKFSSVRASVLLL